MTEEIKFKEFTLEELRKVDETWDLAQGYSVKIMGEGCDEVETLAAYEWDYCPAIQAWRFSCGHDSRRDERLTGWRFAVYVDYRGETVHCSGFVFSSFREAAEAITGQAPVMAWCRDLDGSEEHAAPFSDPRIHRKAVREKPYQK